MQAKNESTYPGGSQPGSGVRRSGSDAGWRPYGPGQDEPDQNNSPDQIRLRNRHRESVAGTTKEKVSTTSPAGIAESRSRRVTIDVPSPAARGVPGSVPEIGPEATGLRAKPGPYRRAGTAPRPDRGRSAFLLTVIDEFTREAIWVECSRLLNSHDVIRVLDQLVENAAIRRPSKATMARSSWPTGSRSGSRIVPSIRGSSSLEAPCSAAALRDPPGSTPCSRSAPASGHQSLLHSRGSIRGRGTAFGGLFTTASS